MFKATLVLSFFAAIAATDTCFDGHCAAKSDVMLQAELGKRHARASQHTMTRAVTRLECADVLSSDSSQGIDSRTCPDAPNFNHSNCVHYVLTQNGNCKSYCENHGLFCSRAQDNTGDSCNLDDRVDRQTTEENGCLQQWNNQVCECAEFPSSSIDRINETCRSERILDFTNVDNVAFLRNNKELESATNLMTFKTVLDGIDLTIEAQAGYSCGRCDRNGGSGQLGRLNVQRGSVSDFRGIFSKPLPFDVQFVILDFDFGELSPSQSENFLIKKNVPWLVQHGGLVTLTDHADSYNFTAKEPEPGPRGLGNPENPLALTADQKDRSVTVFLPEGMTQFDFQMGVLEKDPPNRGRNLFFSGATNAQC